jgi:hypothetical protein
MAKSPYARHLGNFADDRATRAGGGCAVRFGLYLWVTAATVGSDIWVWAGQGADTAMGGVGKFWLGV